MKFGFRIRKFLNNEDGPTAVEYAVMLALIVGTCVGAVHLLADATADNIDRSATAIEDAMSP